MKAQMNPNTVVAWFSKASNYTFNIENGSELQEFLEKHNTNDENVLSIDCCNNEALRDGEVLFVAENDEVYLSSLDELRDYFIKNKDKIWGDTNV